MKNLKEQVHLVVKETQTWKSKSKNMILITASYLDEHTGDRVCPHCQPSNHFRLYDRNIYRLKTLLEISLLAPF